MDDFQDGGWMALLIDTVCPIVLLVLGFQILMEYFP